MIVTTGGRKGNSDMSTGFGLVGFFVKSPTQLQYRDDCAKLGRAMKKRSASSATS
jgi:hypothetical protein